MEKNFLCGNLSIKYASAIFNKDYYESHCHTNLEVIFVLGGNVEIIIEEKKYIIDKPCAIFLLPTVYHSIFPNKNSPYERITCQFPSSVIPSAIFDKFIFQIKENPVIESDEIIRLQNKLKDILIQKDEIEYSSYILALICELFYLTLDSTTQSVSYKPDETISDVISYINNNLDKMITLEDISKKLYVSSSTISHMFRKYLNISVKKYILQKKILLAQRYLDNGIGATVVAKMLGYNNYSNFCKIYKKMAGKFPKINKKTGQL